MSDKLLERAGLKFSDVACVLCANISAQDGAAMQQAFEGKCLRSARPTASPTDTSRYGFPLNYLSLIESGSVKQGDHVLGVSHGMGATAAVSLLRY